MKKINELSFCRPNSCCPKFSLLIDDVGEKWLEIKDDFGGIIRIVADKDAIKDILDKLFK